MKTIKVKSLDGKSVKKHRAKEIIRCRNANYRPLYTIILDTGRHYPITCSRLIDHGGLLDD